MRDHLPEETRERLALAGRIRSIYAKKKQKHTRARSICLNTWGFAEVTPM